MKLLKKLSLALVAIMVCVSFAACGGGGDDGGSGSGGNSGGGDNTPPVSSITSETVSSGNVTSVAATVYCKVSKTDGVNPFQVGAIVSEKQSVSATDYAYLGNPTTLTSTEYSLTFSGLKAGTTYYYRSFYYNGKSYVYGAVKSFTTKASIPAYVDLGLPSGTLWATTNVGAEKPEDYGCYYAWSSPIPMGNVRSKVYDVDEVDDVIPADIAKLDAAYVYFGEGWHSPTTTQINELLKADNCKWEWCDGITKRYGNTSVAGYVVTSKSKPTASIFLPAAGYYNGANVVDAGKKGYYWSRRGTMTTDNPTVLQITSVTYGRGAMPSDQGMTVRPVRDAK